MANCRAKNRRRVSVCLLDDEEAAAQELVRVGVAKNRSDLLRLAFNEWRKKKRPLPDGETGKGQRMRT